jgi:thiol-disulfide isomerase/thioredoxin
MDSPKTPASRWPIIVLGLVIGLGLYFLQTPMRKGKVAEAVGSTAASPGLKSLATGSMVGLVVHAAPKPVPPVSFADGKGAPKNLADWKGRTVVLNLWATWCTPCKKEMPDLSKLQKALGSKDFEVVALSLDRKGAEASAAFLKTTGADKLAVYVEPEGKTLNALQALGLPATVIIDKNGMEVARLLGPAEWSSPEAIAFIRAVIKP